MSKENLYENPEACQICKSYAGDSEMDCAGLSTRCLSKDRAIIVILDKIYRKL